jgi:hypothetical protein
MNFFASKKNPKLKQIAGSILFCEKNLCEVNLNSFIKGVNLNEFETIFIGKIYSLRLKGDERFALLAIERTAKKEHHFWVCNQ